MADGTSEGSSDGPAPSHRGPPLPAPPTTADAMLSTDGRPLLEDGPRPDDRPPTGDATPRAHRPPAGDRSLETVETVAPNLPAGRVRFRAPAAPPAEPRRRPWRTLFGWLVVAGLGWAAWHYAPVWRPWVEARLTGAEAAPAKGGPRTVPVTTAAAERRDLDLYLTGLGTVTALNTVTVRSRVDGELINVAFTEGQRVKQGDLLAEIDPRPFAALKDQAEGQLARDESTLALAKLNLERVEGLYRSKAATKQLVDEQQATVRQAEAAVRVSRAAVDDAAVRLGYCRIVSPIDGRAGLRLVDRGNIVRAGDPTGLVVITQLEPIALVFTVPQDDIPRVQKRMRETETPAVEAFDRDFRTKLAAGTLSAIDNQVDPATGTLRLKATFENGDRGLFPNQFVNAKLLVDTLRGAVVVPSEAVQRGPEGRFVYVVKADDTVELRPVTVGPEEAGATALTAGVEPGERVVTGGIDKLQPGSKVAPDGTEAGKPGAEKPGEAGSRAKAPSRGGKEATSRG